MLIYEKTIASTDEVANMPAGAIVIVQTSADADIQFWNPLTGAYDVATTVAAPGGFLGVPHNKALITGAASVRILQAQ